MTPNEILHDALQQCINLTNVSNFDVCFKHEPYIDAYSVSVWDPRKKDIVFSLSIVKLNETEHLYNMQLLKGFLERSESVATR